MPSVARFGNAAMRLAAMLLGTWVFSSAAAADPKANYLLHCRGCHLADGRGVPPEVPTLINVIGRLVAIEGGREYVVRVPGVAQTSLSDKDLAEVLNYVMVELNAATLPANFKPFTAAEIATYRPLALADPARHRAKLLSSAASR